MMSPPMNVKRVRSIVKQKDNIQDDCSRLLKSRICDVLPRITLLPKNTMVVRAQLRKPLQFYTGTVGTGDKYVRCDDLFTDCVPHCIQLAHVAGSVKVG